MKSLWVFVAAIGSLALSACDIGKPSLDDRCKEVMSMDVEQDKANPARKAAVAMSEYDAFYSESLRTCVMTSVNVISDDYHILDLSRGFMRDWPNLFQCNADLHFEADLAKVRRLNGYVANVTYDDWGITDDRSAQTKIKLSREECDQRFRAMLRRVR